MVFVVKFYMATSDAIGWKVSHTGTFENSGVFGKTMYGYRDQVQATYIYKLLTASGASPSLVESILNTDSIASVSSKMGYVLIVPAYQGGEPVRSLLTAKKPAGHVCMHEMLTCGADDENQTVHIGIANNSRTQQLLEAFVKVTNIRVTRSSSAPAAMLTVELPLAPSSPKRIMEADDNIQQIPTAPSPKRVMEAADVISNNAKRSRLDAEVDAAIMLEGQTIDDDESLLQSLLNIDQHEPLTFLQQMECHVRMIRQCVDHIRVPLTTTPPAPMCVCTIPEIALRTSLAYKSVNTFAQFLKGKLLSAIVRSHLMISEASTVEFACELPYHHLPLNRTHSRILVGMKAGPNCVLCLLHFETPTRTQDGPYISAQLALGTCDDKYASQLISEYRTLDQHTTPTVVQFVSGIHLRFDQALEDLLQNYAPVNGQGRELTRTDMVNTMCAPETDVEETFCIMLSDCLVRALPTDDQLPVVDTSSLNEARTNNRSNAAHMLGLLTSPEVLAVYQLCDIIMNLTAARENSIQNARALL